MFNKKIKKAGVFQLLRYITLIVLCLHFNVFTTFGQTSLIKLEASRAGNNGLSNYNPQGVLPVLLRWEKSGGDNPLNYHVYRSVRTNTGFERIFGEVKEDGRYFTFIDINSAAIPGKPYYYRIMFVNSTGEISVLSETVMGYGALSPERYFLEFVKTIGSSHQKLTLMYKPGNMSKLGSEQKPGAISGTLLYNARIAGLGGRVIMEYDRYADFYIDNDRSLGPYFVLTGNMNTTASMAKNGTMDGTIFITGMYPGRIYYDRVQIKDGLPGGGSYGVERDGFPRVELSWSTGQ
jgi:hypothetical protein